MNKSYAEFEGPILKITDVHDVLTLAFEEGKDKSDYQQKHNINIRVLKRIINSNDMVFHLFYLLTKSRRVSSCL